MIIYTLSGLGNVKPIFIRFAGQFNDELFIFQMTASSYNSTNLSD